MISALVMLICIGAGTGNCRTEVIPLAFEGPDAQQQCADRATQWAAEHPDMRLDHFNCINSNRRVPPFPLPPGGLAK